MTARLELDSVAAERSGIRVFDGVTLAVDGGRALIIRGPNGAGKTTLIRLIAGFLPPLEGTVRLNGCDDEMSVGEQSHMVGHANAIKSTLTVRENLAFWQRYLGGPSDAVDRAIAFFALGPLADIPAGLLSAGQKRRTGLARLLVAPRPVWLLDEPTTSLDVSNSEIVEHAVAGHLEAGGIAVIATHLPMAIELADVWSFPAARGAVFGRMDA